VPPCPIDCLSIIHYDNANVLCCRIAEGAVTGAAGTVIATPVIMATVGFTTTGVAAGSLAATAQAYIGGTAAFATAQSIGAAGLGMSGTTIAASVGGMVGGYVSKAASFFCYDVVRCCD